MRNLVIIALLISSCSFEKTEYSQLMTEPALVVDSIYSPSTHESSVKTNLEYRFDWWDGDYRLMPVTRPTIVTVPPKYAIIFQCPHGKFVIDSQENGERLWRKLTPGQRVVIHYREIFKVKYDDGKCLYRNLCGYDFIDAVPFIDTDLEAAK